MRFFIPALALVACALSPSVAAAQDSEPEGPAQVVGTINEPVKRAATAARIAGLQVASGFRLSVAARGLGRARMLAVADDGTLFVTRRETGDILSLRDRDRDGIYDRTRVALGGMPMVHGIALRGKAVRLVTDTRLYAARLDGDKIVDRRLLRTDLPDAGQHPNRTLAWGADGLLYLSIGSTCNACDDSNPQNATLVRMRADGAQRRVYARGLRNTIGFDWNAQGALWGMDHGSDWRGDDQPPEELNRIVRQGNYGWPFCFGNRLSDIFTVADPPGQSGAQYCAKTRAPALTYTAHAAPLAFAFAEGTAFPAGHRDDAFVTMRGSWNRGEPSGYRVLRVRYEQGRPAAFEDFVSGFLTEGGRAQFARLTGLTFDRDGSLLFTDDANGVMYRVSAA